MAQMTIAEIRKDDRFESFLLVRGAEVRTASNGKQYLDMTLGDRTGNINAKLWDGTVAPPPQGSIVKVRGTGNEYNGRMQLRIERIKVAGDGDEVDLSDLVPSAPRPGGEMLAEVKEVVGRIADDDIRNIVDEMLAQAGDKLLIYPAAQKMHHAQLGGLLQHMTTMLKAAAALAGVYTELDPDLLNAGVIIHDLAKLEELDADDLGVVKDYTVEGKLIGHIVKGVINIDRAAIKVGARPDKAQLLQHMVLSHHGKPEFGSPVLPKFPEAEVLNLLDTLDARMYEMLEALERTMEGGFSEKVWAMENRQLYRIPAQEPGEENRA